jgi:integrase/recombinase XerD
MGRPNVAAVAMDPHLEGFVTVTRARGYAETTVGAKRATAVQLGRWLAQQGLGVDALNEELTAAFAADHRQAGHVPASPRTLRQLLDYLRDIGVSPPAVPPVPSPSELLVDSYRAHLVDERGLAPVTLGNYLRTARRFVAARGGPDGLGGLGARDVSAFVIGAAADYSTRTVNETVGELRSFLRFLHRSGVIASPLAQAALRRPGWSGGGLPKGVAPGVVEALVSSCARDTLAGTRDYAILVLLSRLGLRACEVARLETGDVDWRRGELSVRGKANSVEVLPLPVDVGTALGEYLVRRGPHTSCRRLLLHVVAFAPPELRTTDVHAAVRRACGRAGIPLVATHRLRHTTATAMLAAGVPLGVIGQVLRQRAPATTALYAKVDTAALSTVAKAWPGTPS